MITTTVDVQDMHCGNCSSRISTRLNERAEIQNISVNPVKRRVFVSHDETLSPVDIVADIRRLGFSPRLDAAQTASTYRSPLRRLGVAGICAMQVMMIQIALYAGDFQGMQHGIERLLQFASLVFCIPIVAYAATPFFTKGLRLVTPEGTKTRLNINMDTPIALAIAIAFSISTWSTLAGSGEVYFDSVAMFTFLMLGARYLDQRLKARLSVHEDMTASLPKFITRMKPAGPASPACREEVTLDNLEVGDDVWVNEGQQLAADGTLLSEYAHLDNSMLTGETLVDKKRRNDQLYAGTMNEGPGFAMRVTQLPSTSRLATIDKMASLASAHKLKQVYTADKVARYFVPSILLLSGGTYLYWHLAGSSSPMAYALAVLVISCPCALSLAIPAAVSAALSRLRSDGLLVRDSRVLERIGGLRQVYFDKTGTLTSPAPVLRTVKTQLDESLCLRYVAALERHSQHPLARTFHIYDDGTPVADIETVQGAGLKGNIEGHAVAVGSADFCGVREDTAVSGKPIYLTVDTELAAVFLLENDLRDDAGDAVSSLQRRGLDVAILSGDNKAACDQISHRLGIGCVANSSPEEKFREVASHRGTLYVGDGLNDLPALASSDVSISTLETVDLVKAKADVLLMSDRLTSITSILDVGARFSAIVKQNLIWAVAYNLIAIPLAMIGLATPWLAALGMSASSIIVMLNSCRLLRT